MMPVVLFEMEISELDYLAKGTTRGVTKRRFLTRTGLKIPLANGVRGPCCKLRTECFRSLRAWAINRRGKTRIRNLQYGPRKRG